ncbi:hypothetical protein L3Y34_019886 [Caenorhabditis briggsae]|uniref:Uncharacterized protein n=1 Tax=Caenorhabditis briggsae TaxID=6238 RepID=A0AAE9IWP2_CAEBR|nr:hypothetical protein L3Y34_019886 [Caenorhabditis briggsae]
MIDVHCHLVDNKFKENLDDVISHAQSSGVVKLINVPEFESQFESSIEITKKWKGVVYTGIGIHPIQKRGKSAQMKHISKMEQFFVEHERDIICVADLEEQERVFKWQINLAKHFEKPLNVHSRSAARRTIEVLTECHVAPDRVILHAFDGGLEDAKMGSEAGYLFSVPPSFVRSEKVAEVFNSIPIDQILLETDSPALGPEQGVKNVPSNLIISAEWISKIKDIPVEDVVRATSANANRVFRFS